MHLWSCFPTMPVPNLYTCTDCDFRGTSISGWGRFEYQASNSIRYNIPRNSGICYKCNRVCPVEILPDQAHWRQLAEKARSSEMKDNSFFYTHYIEMKVLQKLMRFRTSPPRCLFCGGHDFDAIPSELPGLIHRGCGGVIQVDSKNGPHLFYGDGERLPWRVYSMDGLELG